MIRNRICVIALAAASVIAGSAAPASAQMFQPWGSAAPSARPFDGNWGIGAHTTNGHCGSVHFGVVISGTRIAGASSYGGQQARLTGRVDRAGRVQVQAVSGPRSAKGSGQFDQFHGSGTWAGRGPSGTCSGVWQAYRS
jgi:hypothetical protein